MYIDTYIHISVCILNKYVYVCVYMYEASSKNKITNNAYDVHMYVHIQERKRKKKM